MIRWLIAVCVVLGALCGVQWTTLTRLKADLASADARAYRAALVELRDRREEFLRVMTWLDMALRRGEAQAGDSGLCRDGTPDTEAVGTWVFDVYLRARTDGLSEAEARQKVLDAIDQTARRR